IQTARQKIKAGSKAGENMAIRSHLCSSGLHTDWQMFREAATYSTTTDLEEYTSSVTSYIGKCIDDVTVCKTITTRPNQKPWMTAEVRALLKARDSAFKAGDKAALRKARAKLSRAIRQAKRTHGQSIHSHFRDSGDTRHMWQGIQAVTNYRTTPPACDSDATLPDALNHFYTRFETQNGVAARKTTPPSDDQVLCLTAADVRKTLHRVDCVDFSSAFNTIIPQHLIRKLNLLGRNTSLSNWILDFQTGRPQSVRIGQNTSSTTTLSTRAPQGCVLSPLLFTLLTHDCAAMHSSNHIIKFADDTTTKPELHCGDHQKHQVPWSSPSRGSYLVPQHKHHNQESPAASLLPAKAEEGTSPTSHPHHLLQRNHREHPEQLHHCLVWELQSDRKSLQQVVRTAEKIIGVSLPTIMDIYTTRCIRKATSIVDDYTHPSHTLFTLLPSGKRYRGIQALTSRLCNSFFPQAIRLLNT
ncbi:hypothetical protein NFI96_029745, partial [Prochilodus magdalenae]